MVSGQPRCIALFSGCGGLDLGLSRAGFRIELATDCDQLCAESHQANLGGVPFFCGDVADLDANVVNRLAGPNASKGLDLLAGGPPCPPFSKSRFYRKDKPRALDDPLGQHTLGGYLGLLSELRPKAFLLENVPGLAYKVHRDALDHITDTAASLGYETQWRVLNAADYGVPQIRERCFVVGVRDGAGFEWPTPTHIDPEKLGPGDGGRLPWRTAGEALSGLSGPSPDDTTSYVAGGKDRVLLEQIPPGQNYLFFTAERDHPNPQFKWRSRYWSFLLKLSPDKPSWTIQAKRSNNMGPFHWDSRILTIEEIKRIQGFPDDWFLSGNVEQQWRQIGNAVPPALAEAIGRQLAAAVSARSTRSRG